MGHANADRPRPNDSTYQEDRSLFWLVAGGIFASVVLAAAMGYAQAELLTAPGESVTSLDSSEMLDIARSTAFALGALGAVAVLLVNYRKQRSVEAALRHDQSKHRDDLAHEHRKQQASEIAALHERYTKAVEQLANDDKPAIRLGGVHALAALGNDWAAQEVYSQRQMCVDLLCSYLRSVPRLKKTGGTNSEPVEGDYDFEFLKKDRDVRKAALEWLSSLAAADAAATESGDAENRAPAVLIDLRGIILREMNLRYAKLAHLDMRGADLHHANLNHAELTGADLTGAYLEGAGLMRAELNDATLTLANLRGARLRKATLINTDLSRANLEAADFVGADLTGAKLCAAKVSGKTGLRGAILNGTDFNHVNVDRMDLLELKGIDISQAKNFVPPGQNIPAESQETPATSNAEGQPIGESSIESPDMV